MSDLDIAKAIKHCPYRNTNMRGKCRDGRYDARVIRWKRLTILYLRLCNR